MSVRVGQCGHPEVDAVLWDLVPTLCLWVLHVCVCVCACVRACVCVFRPSFFISMFRVSSTSRIIIYDSTNMREVEKIKSCKIVKGSSEVYRTVHSTILNSSCMVYIRKKTRTSKHKIYITLDRGGNRWCPCFAGLLYSAFSSGAKSSGTTHPHSLRRSMQSVVSS